MPLKDFNKPIASVSLDLDDYWTYLKSNADEKWREYPSYLSWIVPRILDFFDQLGVKITFFLVGQDIVNPKNWTVLKSIAEAGHELGNHSMSHDQWMTQYSIERINDEIANPEKLIEELSGSKPLGYRGPGYSFSKEIAKLLMERNYLYDCSSWPTFVGPISHLYFSLNSNFRRINKEYRSGLFGDWKDFFRSNKPFTWQFKDLSLLEIPVTTMPVIKTPIHPTYILFLYQYSQSLATRYFSTAVHTCAKFSISPSILFHCTDFIGIDDPVDLGFMPNMKMTFEEKIRCLKQLMSIIESSNQLVPMEIHAKHILSNGHLKTSHTNRISDKL